MLKKSSSQKASKDADTSTLNERSAAESDIEFQARMLEGVSRTFALTIPYLPDALFPKVANAYLLCRILDTIEDEPALEAQDKEYYGKRFSRIVAGEEDLGDFAEALASRLSDSTLEAERELVACTDRVIEITHHFDEPAQGVLIRCVQVMSQGMIHFQNQGAAQGLKNLKEMEAYCYYVAGVVGEMLTELYALHSDALYAVRNELLPLGRSFGQGLQMTNILKDIWDDQERAACWLPADIFQAHGCDLKHFQSGDQGFQAGVKDLIAIAHGHLKHALDYTLMIPADEPGIRKFCLLALGMAVLSLRKLNQNLSFDDSSQVKISRKSVGFTVKWVQLAARHDWLLRLIFKLISIGVPSVKTKPPEVNGYAK